MKKCGFCFMREGDRCYADPVDREKDGTSKKVVENTQDCDVPEQFVSKGKFYQFLADCVSDKNE